MAFIFQKLSIPDVVLITAQSHFDGRGCFLESYKKSDFMRHGITLEFVQDNHIRSQKNVVRGFHYQLAPFAQGKLIRVVRGQLFNVVIDLRQGSPYYEKTVSLAIKATDEQMLWVPPGFANGNCSLDNDVEVIYKVTHEYNPCYERGIFWNDPELNIRWPVSNPIISNRDAALPTLSQAEHNFTFQ